MGGVSTGEAFDFEPGTPVVGKIKKVLGKDSDDEDKKEKGE